MLHRFQPLQAGVCDPGAIQIQLAQLGHACKLLETGVGDRRAEQVQFSQSHQIFEMDQARIADAGAVQVELGEIFQSADVFEAIVGNERVPQVKFRELTHAGQASHPFIVERSIAHVEITQVDEWRKRSSLHLRLRQPQLPEIRQFRQESQALVLNIDVGQEMQAEMKFFKPCQIGYGSELVISIQPTARIWIPLRSGQFELAQPAQAAKSFEVGGLKQRTHQIDTAEADTARPQTLGANHP